MKSAKAKKIDLDIEQEADEHAVEMGRKIADLRKERGLTLQRAGQITGVAASTLSKIERDDISPTISTLTRIATGFGIDVVQLLSNKEEVQFLPGRRSITRAGTGRTYNSATCVNELLCHDLKHKHMTPLYTKIGARTVGDYTNWPKSDTEIFLFVVKGTLVVNSRLYEPIELSEGDSMYYDASTEHLWTSKGPVDAEILWVITGYDQAEKHLPAAE
jgi:transcriptional regulator with XRE-family HTH domain